MSSAPHLFHAEPIRFTVFGTPRPQGSTRAFIPKGWKRAVITTDNTNLKPWRQQITATAIALGKPCLDRGTPVEITLNFYFAKPKSVKRNAVVVKPDLDKICRSLFDGITGVLISDDSQIIELHARKHYGGPERVEIELREAIA